MSTTDDTDVEQVEHMIRTRLAFTQLARAFRAFQDKYTGGKRWYYKVKNAPGVYVRAVAIDNPTRFTILREDVEPSIINRIPSDCTNVLVLWDSTWQDDDVFVEPRIELPWGTGIILHGITIVEEEITDDLTVLIQPMEGRATRLHVSPMTDYHRKIMGGVGKANETLGDLRPGRWLPKSFLRDRN